VNYSVWSFKVQPDFDAVCGHMTKEGTEQWGFWTVSGVAGVIRHARPRGFRSAINGARPYAVAQYRKAPETQYSPRDLPGWIYQPLASKIQSSLGIDMVDSIAVNYRKDG
jgi:hypothetical protein